MRNEPVSDFLHHLLSNLYEIKTAAYLNSTQYFLPNGTVLTHETKFHFREIINPTDLNVGAKFVQCLPDNHQKMVFLYNGLVRARVNDQILKDFNIRSVPELYLLDREHMIRTRISGYRAKTTEGEIRSEIEKMIL